MILRGGVDPESQRRVFQRLTAVKVNARDGMQKAFKRAGQSWHVGVSKRFAGSTGPRSLRNRSGALQRSIKDVVTGSELRDLKLTLSVQGTPYARIQEFGGEVKPKKGKYLTIPTSFNQRDGNNKAEFPSAKALIAAHPKTTFFRRTAKGRLFLFWDKATKKTVVSRSRKISDIRAGSVEKGAAIPMFQLVKSVDIPGPNSPSKRGPSRLGVYDTWRDELPNLRKDLAKISEGIASGVASSLGGA